MDKQQTKRYPGSLASPSNPAKRSRNEPLPFSELLEECGCRISSDAEEYLVADPRKLRRALERRLTLNEPQRRAFSDGLEAHLEPQAALHAALRPMTITGPSSADAGDSFVRLLLNTPPLQRHLTQFLLDRILQNDAAGAAVSTEAQLILGHFRYLDCLADVHELVEKLLEVLPALSPQAQHEAVALLAEVAPPEDHAAVLEMLEGLVGDACEFLIPALRTAENLTLDAAGQARLVAMAVERLQSVEVGDLPAVVQFLLTEAGSSKDVLPALRVTLLLVTPEDPRLAVPDRKGKGKAAAPGEGPEPEIIAAAKQALQFGKGSAEAILKAVKGLTAPQEHQTLDLWLLAVLAGLHPAHKRAVHDVIRRKFAEGHADSGWLQKAISGHKDALSTLFGELLSLAQHLLADSTHLGAVTAGSTLFFSIFSEFPEPYCRQEMLRVLIARLHTTGEPSSAATPALKVLQRLAHECTADLMQYAGFLTVVLEKVSSFDADQLATMFDVFAELVTGACREAGGGGGIGRSRLEDELFIFLSKEIKSGGPEYRRVGAVGVVALVCRLGREVEQHIMAVDAEILDKEEERTGGAMVLGNGGGDDSSTPLVQQYRKARMLLDEALSDSSACPDTQAYICDALAEEAARGRLCRAMMESLLNLLSDALEARFLRGHREWTAGEGQQAWWGYNGGTEDMAISLLPDSLPASVLTTTSAAQQQKADKVQMLFPVIRLVTTLNFQLTGNLVAVDSLLGIPLGLFPQQHASPQTYATLTAPEQRRVILGLFYGVNWCRELANAFAPMVARAVAESAARKSGNHQRSGAGDAPSGAGGNNGSLRVSAADLRMHHMLMARVRGACQMEAALSALLPGAPHGTRLPTLAAGRPPQGGAAGAALLTKAAAGKGKKKGGAKKGAAFNGAENSKGGGGGAATSAGSQLSGSATTATGHTGGGGAAHALEALLSTGNVLSPTERAKMRALLPHSLATFSALAACTPKGPPHAALPCAAYLLADLVEKARASLAGPKKIPAFCHVKEEPAALPPATLLGALCPVLPMLRQHLDAAQCVMQRRASDETLAAEDQAALLPPGAALGAAGGGSAPLSASLAAKTDLVGGSPSELLSVLPFCPAAAGAVSPNAAAAGVLAGTLECVRLLLVYPAATHPEGLKALQSTLSAFSSKPVPSPGSGSQGSQATTASDGSFIVSQWEPPEFVEGCTNAFKYFLKLAPTEDEEDGPSAAEMESWPGVLSVLEALVKLGEKLTAKAAGDARVAAAWAKRLSLMRRKLCESAGLMLRCVWPSADNAIAAVPAAGGWKGRSPQLTEALRLSIAYSNTPLDVVSDYVNQGVLAVTQGPTGKENSEPLAEWPSLSGMTLATWYKVCWEAVLLQWKQVTAAAKSCSNAKASTDAAAAAADVAAAAAAAATAFNELVQVVKTHDRRHAVHITAVKGGCTFVEGLQQVMPFWAMALKDHKEAVLDAMKTVQKGTRMLHSLCDDGKKRKDTVITARVPRLKRDIDKWIMGATAFLKEEDPTLDVTLGELKHRDLAGNVFLSSQIYPEASAPEEDDEMEEEAEEAEE